MFGLRTDSEPCAEQVPWRAPLAIGAALRVALPWYAHGFRSMDEHWQVIEPANSFVHAAWSRAVEWEQGLRCWIYPWLVSWPLRLAEWLGFDDPLWIISFTRALHGLLSTLAIPLVYFGTKALVRAEAAALCAAWFVAVWPFSVYCGIHTQGEMTGALFIAAAIAAPALQWPSRRAAYAAAGALFGCALAIKIDLAVAGLGFGLWQIAHAIASRDLRRGLSRAFALALGALPLVIVVGVVDRASWGSWFHSVLGHARVNLIEGVGNQWGVSPWYTHILYYLDLTGLPALLALVALPWLWRRLPEELRATWFMSLFFVAIFSCLPHKEKRFLAPLVYVGPMIAIATLAHAWDAWRPNPVLSLRSPVLGLRSEAWFVVVTLILSAHFLADAITYFGYLPWSDRIRAIRDAGRIPGIERVISPQWPATFYLSRKVPGLVTGAERSDLATATSGVKNIGIAVDWKDFGIMESLGFRCVPWPSVPSASSDPIPWAYHCKAAQ